MRIWYVVGTVEYWLEPEYQSRDGVHFRVLGCKLYSPDLKYKGYWRWDDIPLAVKRNIRSTVGETLKRERTVRQRERTWIKGHYRTYPTKK